MDRDEKEADEMRIENMAYQTDLDALRYSVSTSTIRSLNIPEQDKNTIIG